MAKTQTNTQPEKTPLAVKKSILSLPENRNTKILLVVVIVLFLASAVMAGYFYKQMHAVKQDPNKAAQEEVQALIKEVGKLIVLPNDEQPTVATVTDPAKLSDQPFFAQAQTGDKVLIYTNAKKAVLYRPASHKIIEVAPINIGGGADASGSQTQNTTPPAPAQDKSQVPIKVVNASGISGLARKVSDKLKTAGYTSITITDAPSNQSQTTILYDQIYSANITDINEVIGNQATAQQGGENEVTIMLGSKFILK